MLSKTIAENASAASSEIFGRVRLKELPTFSNAITLDAYSALSETFVRIPKFENSIKNNVKSALLALIHIFFSFCCNRRRFFFLIYNFFVCVLKNTYHYLESTAGQLRLSAPISSARLVFRILASRNLPLPSFATSHVTVPRGYPHLGSKKIKINNVFRGNAPLHSN